ncbi:MAG TPA: DUF885 domain-containing protein [Mycobacteriales bacterium]|nr:DUF885 domain-containing protein [Mycobacteriales bacterium]
MSTAAPPDPRPLSELVDAFLAETYERNPLVGSGLGLTEYDDRLPDRSAAAWADERAATQRWLAAFRAVPDTGLTPDDRADRDVAIATLAGAAITADTAPEKRDPDVYGGSGLSAVHSLFLFRPHDATTVASACARLRAIPDLLAQGRANLDATYASPLLLKRAAQQAAGGVAYCQSGVADQVDDPVLAARLLEAGSEAADAYQEWGRHLTKLADQATGDWALGEERYSRLLREREGLPYGADGLHERGLAAYAELEAEMVRLTREIAGHDDWRRLVQELTGDHPASREEMLAEYTATTQRAREFLVAHDIVPFAQGERCEVLPSPVFMRAFLAVAFYQPPPALQASKVGYFFVPYPPDDSTPEQVDARLRTNSRFSIPTISVHEAYPGHHWHLSWRAATQKRVIRSVLTTPYFSEGWGLYAEQCLREAGFYTDKRHELGQVEARLFRAARIVCDTGLHALGWTWDQGVEHMVGHTSLSRPTAEAEVTRYCAWPTQAPSYLTGALEIDRMAREWVGSGRPLKDFHARLAGQGCLPLGIAERLLHDTADEPAPTSQHSS